MSYPGFNLEEYKRIFRSHFDEFLYSPLISINPYEQNLGWFKTYINRNYISYINIINDVLNSFIEVKTGNFLERVYMGRQYEILPIYQNNNPESILYVKKSDFNYDCCLKTGLEDLNKTLLKSCVLGDFKLLRPNTRYIYGYYILGVDPWHKERKIHRFIEIPKNDDVLFYQNTLMQIRIFLINYILRCPKVFAPGYIRPRWSELELIGENIFKEEYKENFKNLLNINEELYKGDIYLDKNIYL